MAMAEFHEVPLLAEQDGPVYRMTFNRPHRLNAATPEMEDLIVAGCEYVNRTPEIRVVVFDGATGRKPSFMAGGDIEGFRGMESADDVRAVESHAERTLRAIENLRVPAIAALDGPVIGQGALLAACCDILVAGPGVRFGFPIARTVGNCLSVRNLTRLTELVGLPLTRRMIMRAALLGIGDLVRTGAVSDTVDTHDELRDLAMRIAQEMAGLAPLTLSFTKSSLLRAREPGSGNEDLVVRSYLSDDSREAVSAFLGKRSPCWRGR
ncbi:enoyl-CoA hydratase [Saccharopolyspora sp. ASAGF58]|nr:enoyl-CoA hydratase [Saccharopolyspora sp. ASAGF58]